MKKLRVLLLTLLIVFITCTGTYANKDNEAKQSKSKQKLIAHQELIDNGIIDRMDTEIEKYYSENKDILITSNDFLYLTAKERKSLVTQIELSMVVSEKNTLSRAYSSNGMSWSAFESGDVVLVHSGWVPYGYYRHGGTYDEDLKKCVSAQLGKGVIWESKSWYNNNYDEAAGYSTRNYNTTTRGEVMKYLKKQIGDDYSLTSSYYNRNSWNCVKLPWVGWYDEADINIAVDVVTRKPLGKASFVLPDSIRFSPEVFRFAYGSK